MKNTPQDLLPSNLSPFQSPYLSSLEKKEGRRENFELKRGGVCEKKSVCKFSKGISRAFV